MADHPPVPAPQMSEAEAEAKLGTDSGNVQAMMAKGDHRFHAGDHRAAAAFYKAAVRTVQQSGASSAGMARDAQRAAAMGLYFDQLFRDYLLASLDKAGFTKTNRHPRFQKSLEMMLGDRERPAEYTRFPQTPLVYYYPDLPYVNFADPTGFDWISRLEAASGAACNEATSLLAGNIDFRPYIQTNKQRPQGDVHGMLENADWSSLYLWQNGAAVDDHVALAPKTFEAVTTHVPLCHIGPRAPSVMLSLLRPGAHIPPHTGMINCRYICHLPLIVPENCGFRVGERTIEWQEGKVILFDDTVQHEAWNRSDKDRLVLIFDIWRPELGEDEREMVRALFAAVDAY
jgi:aspartyl/asparaginyl beta-hydroxylase (cupin superfamily)